MDDLLASAGIPIEQYPLEIQWTLNFGGGEYARFTGRLHTNRVEILLTSTYNTFAQPGYYLINRDEVTRERFEAQARADGAPDWWLAIARRIVEGESNDQQ